MGCVVDTAAQLLWWRVLLTCQGHVPHVDSRLVSSRTGKGMLATMQSRETPEKERTLVLCCGKQHPGGVGLKTQTVCGGILFLMGKQEGQSGPQGRTDQFPPPFPSFSCLSPCLPHSPPRFLSSPYFSALCTLSNLKRMCVWVINCLSTIICVISSERK